MLFICTPGHPEVSKRTSGVNRALVSSVYITLRCYEKECTHTYQESQEVTDVIQLAGIAERFPDISVILNASGIALVVVIEMDHIQGAIAL